MLWADDFVVGEVPRSKQLIEAYEKLQKPVIALIEVEEHDLGKYGVVDIEKKLDDTTFKLKDIVEKPQPNQAPSNLASVGGYVLDRKSTRLNSSH